MSDRIQDLAAGIAGALRPPLEWLDGQEWLWRYVARRIAPLLARRPPLQPPRSPSVRLLREDPDMALVYAIDLPDPGAPDVVKRELEVVRDGGAPEVLDVTAGAPEVRARDGERLVLRLRDTDDAGNAGEWSDPLDFTAADTLAPPAPGAIAVRLVRDEPDAPTDGGTGTGTDAGTGTGTGTDGATGTGTGT